LLWKNFTENTVRINVFYEQWNPLLDSEAIHFSIYAESTQGNTLITVGAWVKNAFVARVLWTANNYHYDFVQKWLMI